MYTRKILGGKIGLVFYDVTTLYFECDYGDELRCAGFSKDGKQKGVSLSVDKVLSIAKTITTVKVKPQVQQIPVKNYDIDAETTTGRAYAMCQLLAHVRWRFLRVPHSRSQEKDSISDSEISELLLEIDDIDLD